MKTWYCPLVDAVESLKFPCAAVGESIDTPQSLGSPHGLVVLYHARLGTWKYLHKKGYIPNSTLEVQNLLTCYESIPENLPIYSPSRTSTTVALNTPRLLRGGEHIRMACSPSLVIVSFVVPISRVFGVAVATNRCSCRDRGTPHPAKHSSQPRQALPNDRTDEG